MEVNFNRDTRKSFNLGSFVTKMPKKNPRKLIQCVVKASQIDCLKQEAKQNQVVILLCFPFTNAKTETKSSIKHSLGISWQNYKFSLLGVQMEPTMFGAASASSSRCPRSAGNAIELPMGNGRSAVASSSGLTSLRSTNLEIRQLLRDFGQAQMNNSNPACLPGGGGSIPHFPGDRSFLLEAARHLEAALRNLRIQYMITRTEPISIVPAEADPPGIFPPEAYEPFVCAADEHVHCLHCLGELSAGNCRLLSCGHYVHVACFFAQGLLPNLPTCYFCQHGPRSYRTIMARRA